MIPDPLDLLRLPDVPIEPRPSFADALWRRIAGGEPPVAPSATVRYFVEDLDVAIAFYRDQLGFEEELHPSPTFAMLYRGELRLLLSVPGEPHALADGTLPEPGGWNRISLRVSNLRMTVAALRANGATFRREIAAGFAVDTALLADPSGNLVELFEPRAGYHERTITKE
jgi:catechol 2,3-dioxygenase-like lactoylglutathione lyase family enzyme